jgi:hypothetical protein
MKSISKIAFFLLISLAFISCKNNDVKANNDDKKDQQKVKKVVTNKNPKDVHMMQKLEGIWQSNHEPVAMQFFEDGSYRRFIPADQNEPDAPEEEFDNGKWTVDAGLLLLNSASGDKEKIILSWMDDELIYLGNIEEEFDPKFGSKEEFAAEFGFSKTN